jgi:hypothetical protein
MNVKIGKWIRPFGPLDPAPVAAGIVATAVISPSTRVRSSTTEFPRRNPIAAPYPDRFAAMPPPPIARERMVDGTTSDPKTVVPVAMSHPLMIDPSETFDQPWHSILPWRADVRAACDDDGDRPVENGEGNGPTTETLDGQIRAIDHHRMIESGANEDGREMARVEFVPLQLRSEPTAVTGLRVTSQIVR